MDEKRRREGYQNSISARCGSSMVIFRNGLVHGHCTTQKIVCSLIACVVVMVFDGGRLVPLPFILVREHGLLGTTSFGQHLKARATPNKHARLMCLHDGITLKPCSFQLRVEHRTADSPSPLSGLHANWAANNREMTVVISNVFDLHDSSSDEEYLRRLKTTKDDLLKEARAIGLDATDQGAADVDGAESFVTLYLRMSDGGMHMSSTDCRVRTNR